MGLFRRAAKRLSVNRIWAANVLVMRICDAFYAFGWPSTCVLGGREETMYTRLKTVRRADKTYRYVHIVESKRVDGKPKQRFIASLGRFADDPVKGLEIARAFARFYEKRIAQGQESQDQGEPLLKVTETRRFGPLAALDEVWRELGMSALFKRLAGDRQFEFPLERAVFAMVAQRILEPGSKLACASWLDEEVLLEGSPALNSDSLYATLSWLEEVGNGVELGVYDSLKESGRLDSVAVFYDTTTTWFEGRGPEELAEFGRVKSGHPKGRRQILVGLVRSEQGWPITHRVFAGNKADVATVQEILLDLRLRFGIKRCVFVGDRGMVSEEILDLLEKLNFQYVVAVKLRGLKEVREQVLPQAFGFEKVRDNLEVKEVHVGQRRYLICRNPQGVERDTKRRADIMEALTKKLGEGNSAHTQHGREILVNRAFRRYVIEREGRILIDEKKIEDDAKTDGLWVLRTNHDLATAPDLALLYKDLGRIERDFRDLKSFLELRPVYHYKSERVKAHVHICILAKTILVELDKRRQASGSKRSVAKLLKDLESIKATRLEVGEFVRWARTEFSSKAAAALKALKIERRLPKTLNSVAEM